MTDLVHQIAGNPWVLIYLAGILTGWQAARRTTRYMLGGRP
jgi:hypothetical protein